jgi:hypothetical protein
LSFRPKRIIASFPRADTLRSGLRRLRYRIQGLDCPLFFYTRAQVSRLADELGAPRSRVDLMGQLHLACFDFKR